MPRVATIFGTRPPDGLTPIKDERVRGRLGELFLKARLGWQEIDSNQHEGRKEEQPIDVEDAERRLDAKIARLVKSLAWREIPPSLPVPERYPLIGELSEACSRSSNTTGRFRDHTAETRRCP